MTSTPRFPRPVCIEMSDTPTHRTRQEGRSSHRPAAPIQRFNNKTIGCPAWFRHFKAVADVHGWDKDQRALQMVLYLDEKAMNVAQELSDRELYDYNVLVKLLSDQFDPASRVSASRSRFHGRTRRHQEDADTYADSITELCRLGYPQSSPELRQELIREPFARGQSDPELKKYLWMVIRTQKDKKLQTLIEVCTDFASLGHTASVHRLAEQVWQDGDTFLHGVRIAGPREDIEDTRHRTATSAPYPPGREDIEDTRHRPAMSTPYPPGREHPSCETSTPRFPRPVCIEMSDTPTHRTRQEGRSSHRPAAPIQRFNNKTIGWPAWFRHFKAVADVHTDGIRINEHCRWSCT